MTRQDETTAIPAPSPPAVESPYWMIQLFAEPATSVAILRVNGLVPQPLPMVVTYGGLIYSYNGAMRDGMFAYLKTSTLNLDAEGTLVTGG